MHPCDSPGLLACVSQSLDLSATPVSPPDHGDLPSDHRHGWRYGFTVLSRAQKFTYMGSSQEKNHPVWKALPKAMICQGKPAPFPLRWGEANPPAFSQGFPAPSPQHIPCTLALAPSHKVSNASLVLYVRSPTYFWLHYSTSSSSK